MSEPEPAVVGGHPTLEIQTAGGPTLITVCASCERMKTVLFLTKDRWICTNCRAEGASAPNMYPIA